MNFEKIPPIPGRKELLDIAFRKAREKASQKELKGTWIQIAQQKESMKIDIVKDTIVSKLDNIIRTFPSFGQLPFFYNELIMHTLDYATLKKSMGAINWAIQKIRAFQQLYVKKIRREQNKSRVEGLVREFYGRLSSILKQIDPQLKYLEASRKMMRTFPDIKDMFTVCIYGFPNVGKTTFLNKLAGTNAKVAAYAFTTTSINSGFIKIGENNIQILDVPGTLAREEKLNSIEMQAEIVLKNLAKVVIFIFDLSGYSGYSIKKQEQLYKKIVNNSNHPVLVYLSKVDITEPEDIEEFKHKHFSVEEIKERIDLMATRYEEERRKIEESQKSEESKEEPLPAIDDDGDEDSEQ
ncbi:50S ribosome-binding GTPase [Candidatus Woesearchaeota archaeon]|nr:50S ribosome-binding GTPase [Candidatus Woesearchaeota archaeon]